MPYTTWLVGDSFYNHSRGNRFQIFNQRVFHEMGNRGMASKALLGLRLDLGFGEPLPLDR
jgi:hypothetical protein